MKYMLPLLMVLSLTACEGYRRPSVDSPGSMSSDTLCYRYAYAKENKLLADEVRARNLDCSEVLRDQSDSGMGAVGESRW